MAYPNISTYASSLFFSFFQHSAALNLLVPTTHVTCIFHTCLCSLISSVRLKVTSNASAIVSTIFCACSANVQESKSAWWHHALIMTSPCPLEGMVIYLLANCKFGQHSSHPARWPGIHGRSFSSSCGWWRQTASYSLGPVCRMRHSTPSPLRTGSAGRTSHTKVNTSTTDLETKLATKFEEQACGKVWTHSSTPCS